MKSLLNKITYELAWTLVPVLALVAWENWNSHQRVTTFLAAQEAGPPTQNPDDSLGGLLNEETAPKTTADENAPPRSIIAQIIDSLSDEEFVLYLGLTSETAEQLDKEEAEFVKTIQSNPKLYEAHLHEEIAKQAASTSQFFANKFGENWASIVDTNNFFFQMSIYQFAEQEALRRTKKGEPTDQQQEEAWIKEMHDYELKSYQSQTNYIAELQDSLKYWGEQEKDRPSDEEYKYRRMDRELRLAQEQAEFDLHRPLWVHLGFLPEDEIHKQDKTLNYRALLDMTILLGKEVARKNREIWNASDPNLRAWIAAEEAKDNAVMARSDTLVGEELERWWDLDASNFDLAASIAMDDAKFARWRASVNEAASPPAQNPGGLLLEETAPVTNTDDNEETSPTPVPSPGSEEETTSGSLGDDATTE